MHFEGKSTFCIHHKSGRRPKYAPLKKANVLTNWGTVFSGNHYDYVLMGAMVSQITGVPIVCSTVFPGADQRKHQSSASLAFFITVTSYGCNGVSNHQPHICLLNSLVGRRSKKTSKFRVTGLCVGNSPGTGEFPAQMASNAENVSIWWRHHVEGNPLTKGQLCGKCFH